MLYISSCGLLFFHSALCWCLSYLYLLYSIVYFLLVRTGCFNPGSWLPYPSLHRVMLPPLRCGTVPQPETFLCEDFHSLLHADPPPLPLTLLALPVSLPGLHFSILLHILLVFVACLPHPECQLCEDRAYIYFVHCQRLQLSEQCWAHNRCSVSI